MEHTHGPWRELAPVVIAATTDPGWGAIAHVSQAETEPEGRANARLIAQAPALLEALEDLVTAQDRLEDDLCPVCDLGSSGDDCHCIERINEVREAWQTARAAIEAAS